MPQSQLSGSCEVSRLLLADSSQADNLIPGAFACMLLPKLKMSRYAAQGKLSRQGLSVYLLALEFRRLNQLRNKLLQCFVKLLKRWALPCRQQQFSSDIAQALSAGWNLVPAVRKAYYSCCHHKLCASISKVNPHLQHIDIGKVNTLQLGLSVSIHNIMHVGAAKAHCSVAGALGMGEQCPAFAADVVFIQSNGQEIALPVTGCCAVHPHLYSALWVQRYLQWTKDGIASSPAMQLMHCCLAMAQAHLLVTRFFGDRCRSQRRGTMPLPHLL